MDSLPFDPTGPVPGPGQGASRAPSLPRVPRHVAIIMDGNGRWANARGLSRTQGHRMGEWALMDTVAGAVEAGVRYLSVYTFSTENWHRSPAEVRFLMTFASDVVRRRVVDLARWGVRVRWSGRAPRLWRSVIRALREAEDATRGNRRLDLVMCVNYGGRAEIVDAARKLGEDVAAGRLHPRAISERSLESRLYLPDVPDVDLLVRTSGEQRVSNYLLWQAAYAELEFVAEPWPDFRRETLWACLAGYGRRDRRFGGATDRPR